MRIIDCGLKHELLTINALAAADYCIIPAQAHYLASEGIPDVLDMVKKVQARFNPRLKIAGILLTMYQSRPQLCQSVKESVHELYGEQAEEKRRLAPSKNITFTRKHFEPYLSKFKDDAELERLFLEFLRQRVG